MSKSLSVPISSWWPVRYYLQVILTAQHYTIQCTNNSWCQCLHLLFYTSDCNLTIRLSVACKKMKQLLKVKDKSCNMCNFYVPFHLSLNAGYLPLALKKEDFSSPKLWSTVAASGNDGATAFVYSVLSHHNQTGFQWEPLKCKASCFNWRRTLERAMS